MTQVTEGAHAPPVEGTNMLDRKIILAAALALTTGACSTAGSNQSLPLAPGSALDLSPARTRSTGYVSVLKTLVRQVTIGSTVDPLNGDQNPYGLALAPGKIPGSKVVSGDAYVCNFNDKANVQGTGTTIVRLAPKPASKPARVLQSASLDGCAATAFDSGNELWAASFSAGDITLYDNTLKLKKTFKGGTYVHPWAVSYTTTGGLYPTAAVFTADAATGSIVLTGYFANGYWMYPGKAIISGFPVNHGKPGNILGPSGLSFDPYATDAKLCGVSPCGALYVADGVSNTVVAIYNVLNLRNTNSIIVGKTGKTFTGPEASWARVLYAGAPLNGPISTALVYPTATNPRKPGNLVVGNTLDPAGKNLLIEISPTGKLLYSANVDKGAAGAIFGISAWPIASAGATTQLFFNDDNSNTLQVLEK